MAFGMSRGPRPLLIGAVLGLLSLRAEARAEAPDAARWVASDAVLAIEIRNPEAVYDQVLRAPFQNVLNALPGYSKAVQGDDFRKFAAVVERIAHQIDLPWDQALRELTGGGMLLAVEAEPGKPARSLLIITSKDGARLAGANKALLALAREDAEAKGQPDPVKSAEYRGFTGYAVGKGGYALVQDRLVFADRAESLKGVIDRIVDGPKAGASLADNADWKARRAQAAPDALALGFVRLDRLRELDPKKFMIDEKARPQLALLAGSWVEAIKQAPWASASLTWTDRRLAAEVTLPTPPGGYPAALKGFVPARGMGAPSLANPPGTIASLGLWRDLSAIWEARAELFSPEVVQGFAKLDTVAGQFFGGRDFGTGVLGALGDDWRLVVARQDYDAMKPVPDVKLPAFALVVDLNGEDDDFAQRLKVAFQSFVGLANLGAAQTKAPPLELGSETCEGVNVLTARFMQPKVAPPTKDPVHQRHNFSPSAAQVGNHFILSSSVGLTRDLVKTLKAPVKEGDATLVLDADGAALAGLLDLNRTRLVMKNMLDKGHDKAQAESEIDTLLALLRYLGHGNLDVRDGGEAVRFGLNFTLGMP